MAESATIRMQVEGALAHKFPSALTPPAKMIRPVVSTGIGSLDELLEGGFPVGAVTELVGGECSGRTSVALSFLAQVTSAGKVCAWIDASNTFDPVSAASVGVDLKRLLWVRCGVKEKIVSQDTRKVALPEACFLTSPVTKGLHGGGHGTHPRSEVKGLSTAIGRFLSAKLTPGQRTEAALKPALPAKKVQQGPAPSVSKASFKKRAREYDAIEQALRSTDLLIQTGGFSAIVLDLGGIAPEFAVRVELSTWHRYRVAAEQTQSSIVLLSQHPSTKSSSELQVRLPAMEDTREAKTVFQGLKVRAEVLRHRFRQTPNNVVPMRKPPQRAHEAYFEPRTSWVGPR
jgi:hypothetical protein